MIKTKLDLLSNLNLKVQDMKFNDKYVFAYMSMARTNRDQPLTMAKDSLLKFNKNIASKYKAGIGLNSTFLFQI